MYPDQGLTGTERWEKITALANRMFWTEWSVDEIVRYYEAVVADDWMMPHGVHKYWATIPCGADNYEVKAKVATYLSLDG